MQERVQALGGHYTVESGRGRGTCVHIVIPVRNGQNGRAATHDQRSHHRRPPDRAAGLPAHLAGCGRAHGARCRDVVSGYRLYRRHNPEVVIIDSCDAGQWARRPALIRRIHAHDPRTRILVFSMHSDPIIVARALEAGATGYVLKDTSSEELVKAFEKVRSGTPYLSGDMAMQVALVQTGVRRNPARRPDPRELETLSQLAQGKPYGRIAEELNVSYKTVGQRLLAAQAEIGRPQPPRADPRCRAAFWPPLPPDRSCAPPQALVVVSWRYTSPYCQRFPRGICKTDRDIPCRTFESNPGDIRGT